MEPSIIASLQIESAEGDDPRIREPIRIFSKQPLFVGREVGSSDLQFESVFLSKTHFRIYSIAAGVDEDSQSQSHSPLVYCEDRLSTNGTYVNDTFIGNYKSPRIPYLLNNNDVITIRPYWRFRFRQILHEAEAPFSKVQIKEMRLFDDLYKVSDRVLGTGQYGKVYAASEVTTQKQLACKILSFEDHLDTAPNLCRNEKDQNKGQYRRNRLFREVDILTQISHPNILSIHKAYYSEYSLYILSELAPGGDLLSFIDANGGSLDDLTACAVCHQLALAVDFLHSNGIAHRDLKPENILIMQTEPGSRLVVSDFDTAICFQKNSRLESLVGTLEYLAPEVFTQKIGHRRCYTAAIDMWAMGIVAVRVLTCVLFTFDEMNGLNQTELAAKLTFESESQKEYQLWNNASENARDFVKSLLVIDVTERMTSRQAVEHDWFRLPNGRETGLYKLHEKTNATWMKRPTNINLSEKLPSTIPRKAIEKLPDTTASPYFGLDRHLKDKSTTKTGLQKHRKLVLESMKKSGSVFIDPPSIPNQFNRFSTQTTIELPVRRNSSSTVLEFQSAPGPWKSNQLRSERGFSNSHFTVHTSGLSKIPEVDPNDMFATEPVEIRAARTAEAAMDEYSQFHHSELNEMNSEYDLQELRPDFEHSMSETKSSQILNGDILRTDDEQISELAASAEEDGNQQDRLSGNLDQMKRKASYIPDGEEEELAVLAYHQARSASGFDRRANQSPTRHRSVNQQLYDDTWNDLRSKAVFVTGKTLREAVAARKLRFREGS